MKPEKHKNVLGNAGKSWHEVQARAAAHSHRPRLKFPPAGRGFGVSELQCLRSLSDNTSFKWLDMQSHTQVYCFLGKVTSLHAIVHHQEGNGCSHP